VAQVRRRVVARGHVQGVFFRDEARRRATESGITGWVSNRDDGAVEIVAQGDADAMADFVRWAEQGPPAARVDSVDIDDQEVVPDESGFDVR